MELKVGFLASCRRNRERQCASEMFYVLTEKLKYAPENIQADRTMISGLTAIRIKEEDPIKVLEKLKAFIEQEENGFYLFRETDKLVPIQIVVPSNMDDIVETAVELFGEREGKWRITINKRYNTLSKDELIKEIASKIDNPVSLTDFDWELRIEIVGGKTGISVLKPNQVLRISKQKILEEQGE